MGRSADPPSPARFLRPLNQFNPRQILLESWNAWLLGAALVWFIFIGGTELGLLYTPVRAINAAIGGIIVGVWVWRMPRRADLTDLLVLGALIAFLVACVASRYPRMSFDAATTAVAFAAALSVARWEVSDPKKARALVTVLAVCALGLILLILPVWTSVWASWISIQGSLPPLDLDLPVGPYRQYHPAGMLFALLLPALLELTQRRLANVLGWMGIVLSIVLIYMAGSRTVWLALALGFVLPLIAARMRISRATVITLAVSSVLLAVLLVTNVLTSIVARLTTGSTVALRFEIWSESIGRWLTSPIFGTGPGSFSAAFTFSDYFQQYERVGRHADNAAVQIVMEAGVMGILTFGLLATALVMGVQRARGRTTMLAVSGIAIFGFMSVTDNPSDTANLAIIGLCWAALCTPAIVTPLATRWSPSWRTAALGLGALVVTVAVSSTRVRPLAIINPLGRCRHIPPGARLGGRARLQARNVPARARIAPGRSRSARRSGRPPPSDRAQSSGYRGPARSCSARGTRRK
jgi:O-antigen ligase